ncbi:VWA domain-containing protein [archaeon]|nr:MAG: VWA domain-containing protein [archaeon]
MQSLDICFMIDATGSMHMDNIFSALKRHGAAAEQPAHAVPPQSGGLSRSRGRERPAHAGRYELQLAN